MIEDKLKRRIQSLLKEHTLYVKHFEAERKELDDKKEQIVDSIKNGTEVEKVEKQLEFLTFGFQTKLADINILTTEIINLYSIAKQSDLDIEVTEQEKEVLEKMLANKRKLSFIPDEKELTERVKGIQEEYMNKLLSSPQYQKIKQDIISSLDN